MSLENHIKRIKGDHRKLDKQIDLMERSGSYDDTDMHHLKKKRLQLKDEITRLEKIDPTHRNGR